ncbi:hypothetical protein MXC99_10595 [Thauera aromatica]|uniref:hypothetical protein n=1 Tax=Thauera aromatica TaxID=59405 RepID=UPI001FFD2EC7|nr:hypothetical protein [Thauera aromatica]MCK2088619.1 hypothetical protein [Thauera aromatica]
MLNTVRATVTPSGTIVFDEAVHLVRPTAVLVTLLEEAVVDPSAAAQDPLSWPLTEAEQQVWDDFPEFRKQHPLSLDSMERGA